MTPLQILYRDDGLAAIDKPARMRVHPEAKKNGIDCNKAVSDQLGR
jgi:23S rRNA-/tRNA-specific pseudouridylate synthase